MKDIAACCGGFFTSIDGRLSPQNSSFTAVLLVLLYALLNAEFADMQSRTVLMADGLLSK